MHSDAERERLKHEHHQMMLVHEHDRRMREASTTPEPGERFKAGLYRPRRIGFPTRTTGWNGFDWLD